MRPQTMRGCIEAASVLMEHARECMVAEYPVGTVVHYEHGDHIRSATVIGHSPYSCGLHVQGVAAAYWLNANRLAPPGGE